MTPQAICSILGVMTVEGHRMPTKGNPRRTFRFEPTLWTAFTEAAKRDPHKRSPTVIVRDFIAWYAGQRGFARPVRPSARDSKEQQD
jgi:hypothetical protein